MGEKRYVLSIDQGTTSTKALLLDRKGQVAAKAYGKTHSLFYPQNGFVEQDAEEIYEETCRIARDVLRQAGAHVEEIAGLSLSVQTGVWIFWDRKTGKPVCPLIGWQCARGEQIVRGMSEGDKEYFFRLNGHVPNAHTVAAKIRWAFEHVDGLGEGVRSGEILMGSDETWLVWKLTKGACHVVEYNNACSTGLFDRKCLSWDSHMLEVFGLEAQMLPQIMSSDSFFGTVEEEGLGGIPVYGVLWDSCAALFSHRSYKMGDAKASYGTGTTTIVNIGTKFPEEDNEHVTVGWGVKGKAHYLRQANALCTGATMRWLADSLGLMGSPEESESLASLVEDTDGVYLVPAFSGLAAPYFDDRARACIVGMTGATTKAHVVRAGLESIAYQVKAMLDSVRSGLEYPCERLFADSGASGNSLLMQFQADLLGMKVVCEEVPDASGVGMAYFGGMASGFYKNLEELKELSARTVEYAPRWDEETRRRHYEGWQRAVEKAHQDF